MRKVSYLSFVTARVRTTREGDVFTLFVRPQGEGVVPLVPSGEGVPQCLVPGAFRGREGRGRVAQSGPGQGYLRLRSSSPSISRTWMPPPRSPPPPPPQHTVDRIRRQQYLFI